MPSSTKKIDDTSASTALPGRPLHTPSSEAATAADPFRVLCENLPLPLVLIDSERRVTFWNSSAVRASGFDVTSSIGKDALEVLPLAEADLMALLADASNHTGVPTARRVQLDTTPIKTYELSAFTLGPDTAVCFEDVSEEETHNAILQAKNTELLDLYQNSPCGYLSVGATGQILRGNVRMAEWLGKASPQELRDLAVDEILTDSGLAHYRNCFGPPTPMAIPLKCELEFRKGKSDTFWGLVNARVSQDAGSGDWYWQWTIGDISDQQVALQQFEESKLFGRLFDELGEAVLVAEASGRIIRANKAATRILGIPIDQLLQMDHDSPAWQAVLDDGTPVATRDMPGVRALREKQPVTNIEMGVVRPDGQLAWILESAAPLFDENGEVSGVIVTFPEVTATVLQRQTLKDLNDSLAIERDRANEANRLKSSFLANMSHEIRTPMTAILGFSDILSGELSGKVSEQHFTFLRSINVSGKRLLTLINDILDLSKIEAGRLELQTEELEVAQEIEASVSPLTWIAKQKGLTLIIEPTAERLMIRGDRQRFGQVVTNIVSNAIKFTRAGSITLRAYTIDPKSSSPGTGALGAGSPGNSSTKRMVRIEIEDTGMGISKEFLPFLFEEFRQEHTGVTKEFGGTGLGLAISKRLVALMGGSVHVHSQQNIGTTFSLEFPFLNVATSGVFRSGGTRPTIAAPSTPKPEPVGEAGDKKRILVVEDNPETQRLLEVYLRANYKVSAAMNSTEAFEAISKELPDVILMDVNLPGKDGLSITRDIRKGNQCPKVPIVALTAFAMTGDRQKCLDAGCNDYLSKPATKREVLDVIAKVMGVAA